MEQNTGQYDNPYKFNGKELDEESGLYYYGARYYNPRLSIWYGVDPLAEKYALIAPYVYTLDNPIKFVDPDGRQSMDWVKRNGRWNWEDNITSRQQAMASGAEDYSDGVSNNTYTSILGSEVTLKPNNRWSEDFTNFNRAELYKAEDRFWGTKADAYSISVGGDLNAIIFNVSFSIGIVLETRKGGEIGIFTSGGSGSGLNLEEGFKPGISGGGKFGWHNSYGGNPDVITGLGGLDQGYSVSLFGQGYEYSESASILNGALRRATSGVESHGINIGKIGINGGARRSLSRGISWNVTRSINQKKMIYGK